MALTEKEIEYISGELPKGMKIVDFREINEPLDLVRKYCTVGERDTLPYGVCLNVALERFIKEGKK